MPSHPSRNCLLEGLPPDEQAILVPLAAHLPMALGDVLCVAGDPTRSAVFPNTGIVSLIAVSDADDRLEMGLVGADGMIGLPLALGFDVSHVTAQVQGPGDAIAFEADEFVGALAQCATLRDQLNRHMYSLMAQITQTALCNGFHSIEMRSARWMLATGDRMQSDRFWLTQSWLATMIGVHRPAVSHAARALSQAGLIRYTRGQVTILDREGLEAATCSCYRIIDRLYRDAIATG